MYAIMELRWNSLPWIGELCHLNEYTLACWKKSGDQTFIVIENESSCLILSFSDWTWNDLKVECIEDQEKSAVALICSQDEIYKFSSKSIFVLSTPNQYFSDVFGIDSGSMSKEKPSWNKIDTLTTEIFAVCRWTEGFAFLEQQFGQIYFVLYEMKDEKLKMKSKCSLAPSFSVQNGKFFLNNFQSSSFPPLFLQKLFKVPIVYRDIVVFALPDGNVYFSGVSDNSKIMPILNESGNLLQMYTISIGIVLIYENGKVIFGSLTNKGCLVFEYRFLPTNVVCAHLIENLEGLVLLWSDGNFVYHTDTIKYNDLQIRIFKTKLSGIIKFIELVDNVLCVNMYGNFYTIVINKSESVKPYVCPLLKETISLENLRKHHNAILCEKLDVSLLHINFNESSFQITNNSTLTFYKDVWYLTCTCSDNSVTYCRNISFSSDFQPGHSIETLFSFLKFPNANINVQLKGYLEPQKRLLSINLGIVQNCKIK